MHDIVLVKLFNTFMQKKSPGAFPDPMTSTRKPHISLPGNSQYIEHRNSTTAPSITFTVVQPKVPPKEYKPRVPNFHTRGTVIQLKAILQECVCKTLTLAPQQKVTCV